jgi:acyl carrier protein
MVDLAWGIDANHLHFALSNDTRNTSMSDNFERFKNCAVEVLAVDASAVTTEANFADDLDADSLDLVELVMALEEEFDITVEEEELADVATVGDAVALVESKL